MRKYPFLIDLLSLEVLILTFLFISIIVHRIIDYFIGKTLKKQKAIISNYILTIIEGKEAFDLKNFPGRKSWRRAILITLENFNHILQGEDWEVLRASICKTMLIDKARKWTKSWSWTKRNFAARVFALHSSPEDQIRIIHLMKDHKFLVRNPASLAAVNSESILGIETVLVALSQEPGYAQFVYRDALAQGSQMVIELLIELGNKSGLRKAILSVLGAKSWGKEIPFLKDDLVSPDPEIRALAFGALRHNPIEDTLHFFLKGAVDPNSKVRLEALKGFSLLHDQEGLKILEQCLEDPVWEVRVEAGRALKHKGILGIEILKRQNSKIAKETANYAMQFG